MVISIVGQVDAAAGADDYSDRYHREALDGKARACWSILERHAGGNRDGQSLLDIGCGEGAFLNLAREAGFATAGVELSMHAARIAQEAGHRVICQSITDALPSDLGRFDVVTLWDLLEHLENPRRALEQVREVLAPGGRLFLVTPRMGSVYDRWGLRLFRWTRGRFDPLLRMCWSRDHPFRFDPLGLRSTLASLGLRPIKVESILLLSLRPDRYAGGEILPPWTGSRKIDEVLSRGGVWMADVLRIHNKLFIEAAQERA